MSHAHPQVKSTAEWSKQNVIRHIHILEELKTDHDNGSDGMTQEQYDLTYTKVSISIGKETETHNTRFPNDTI